MAFTLQETKPYVYAATNDAGATVTVTATPKLSGDTVGMRPTELLPAALAACTSIDLRLILEKQRQRLDALDVAIDMQRDKSQTPQVITHITLHYHLQGDIDAGKAKRALDLASEKYCTVYKHLSPTIAITYQLSINDKPL